jgi:hypothetical protein
MSPNLPAMLRNQGVSGSSLDRHVGILPRFRRLQTSRLTAVRKGSPLTTRFYWDGAATLCCWYLIGGFNQPLWKMMEWKSVGIMTFPIYGKTNNVPKHQPNRLYTFRYLQVIPIISHETSGNNNRIHPTESAHRYGKSKYRLDHFLRKSGLVSFCWFTGGFINIIQVGYIDISQYSRISIFPGRPLYPLGYLYGFSSETSHFWV